MKKFVENMLQCMRYFTLFDLSLFKICLIAVGMLLGYYCYSYISNYLWIVWAVAIVSYIYLMVKLVRYYNNREQ